MAQQNKSAVQRRAVNNRDDNVINISRLFRALWHRAWLIALLGVLAGAAAFGYSAYMITPLYQSQALMYVNNSSISIGSTSLSISNSDLTAAQSLVSTYSVILKSRTALEQVIEEADLDYTYEELYAMVKAEAVDETEIFSITVTSDDPTEAALIANTIAEVLPDVITGILDGSSAVVVDYAVVPSSKTSPNVSGNTAKGLLAGMVVACMIIIVLELMNDKIQDVDYLLKTYDVPILASIPDLKSTKGSIYYKGYYGRKRGKDPKEKGA